MLICEIIIIIIYTRHPHFLIHISKLLSQKLLIEIDLKSISFHENILSLQKTHCSSVFAISYFQNTRTRAGSRKGKEAQQKLVILSI